VRFRWTAHSVQNLVSMTEAGKSASVIARRLGCIMRTVQLKQIELELRQRVEKRFWTGHELIIVRKFYPDTPTEKVAEMLGRSTSMVYQCADRLGLHKTAEYLASPDACRLRRGDRIGATTRYAKGNVPANKGLRRPGYGPGRMRETQFKNGNRTGAANRNWKPVGSIRPDDEGYLRIKVREHQPGEPNGFGNTKIWPLLQRHIWEQHFGPIPEGHNIVFRDGNRKNCDIANLEMISRAELMRRNTIHNYPPELRDNIMLLGAIKRKLRETSEKQDDRSAKPSV
jgi:hypothetical protein